VSAYVLAGLRLLTGFVFLWAFLDKTFGLGYATPSGKGWLDGGSPTRGFLGGVAVGPMESVFHSWAGDAWADWLFMAGLLGIGVALTLGIGMRIAAAAGALMYALMWAASLPLENHPFIDDHVIGAVTVVTLALLLAGDTWGLGQRWARSGIVRRYAALR
jgi:thiosulfate dehydrogenase (quinone) large subunit